MSEFSENFNHTFDENRANEQYFYTPETTRALVNLCVGRTACLFTPSVALAASIDGKETIAFDVDKRFQSVLGSSYQYYDANKGIHGRDQVSGKVLAPMYEYAFDTVIADPPYSAVTLERIASNVNSMLKWDLEGNTYAYITHLGNCFHGLEKAFERYQMVGQAIEDFQINYNKPPRSVIKKGVSLYQFRRV